MRATSIGWQTTPIVCSMRQGASGTLRIRLVVVDEDGAPLPSYDGFQAGLALTRERSSGLAVSLSAEVAGDAATQTITVDVTFRPDDTIALAPGAFRGVVAVREPSGGRQYPVSVTLHVERVPGAGEVP